jgi:hypothetical protein
LIIKTFNKASVTSLKNNKKQKKKQKRRKRNATYLSLFHLLSFSTHFLKKENKRKEKNQPLNI